MVYYSILKLSPSRTKLAPILYNLYSNNVVNSFKYAKVKMYADDLTIYAIIKNDNERIYLQTDSNNLAC